MSMFNKIRYTFFSGKNRKFSYFVKSYIQYWTPRPLLQRRLKSKLASIEKRTDKAYILERVNYYNKLERAFVLPQTKPKLAEHKPNKQKVYFFDTYKYTRFFADNFSWSFLPGDIVHVPDCPTIVKSRPLAPNNENSILLKLDRVRHFIFLKDKKAFQEKKDKVIFRGKVMDKAIRLNFMQQFSAHPMCDAGDVSKKPIKAEWKKPKMSLWEHLDYKFIMALEENDVASNLKWIMSSNSIAVMPRPTCETWFMEGKLEANVHYIEVQEDFSDLEERLNYYIAHPNEAEQIIKNAHAYVAQFFDEEREDLISLAVLEKYFRLSQQ